VPLVLKMVEPRSIIDLGCGDGSWLKAFEEQGIRDLQGIENQMPANPLIERGRVQIHNLCHPYYSKRTYDLALCLEVAEHLPEKAASTLIETLTGLASVVLFSAAIPHQGGDGHVNEQWNSYWHQLFLKCKYVLCDPIRSEIWNNSQVAWWYRQNMFLAVSENHSLAGNLPGYHLQYVHPEQYLQKIKALQSILAGNISLRSAVSILRRSIYKVRVEEQTRASTPRNNKD